MSAPLSVPPKVGAARATLLRVEGLTVQFPAASGWATVVDHVSLEIPASTTVGLVGESGSGKTVTALAVMGLLRAQGGRVVGGSVNFDGVELTGMSERQMSEVRGDEIGMVFQQPVRSLDPAFTVGDQIAETVRRHRGVKRAVAWERAVEMLDRVHITEPERRARSYPHQLSGGMCQRVMIAIALACEPKLLIADEPTTALDVTVQARVLDLLREVQRDTGVAILFISHDLGVIAEIAESVSVMYAGHVVEQAPVEQLFVRPGHPYTEGLLGAIPKRGQARRYVAIPGNVPMAGQAPTGCPFHPRCRYAVVGRCDTELPALVEVRARQNVRCVRAEELELQGVLVQ